MTLTDEEKSEARGTDPRAAAIIDRCDDMSAETLGAPARADAPVRPDQPSRPTSRGRGSGIETIGARRPLVGPRGRRVVRPLDRVGLDRRRARSPRARAVRLRPSHRADAQDIFLVGPDRHRGRRVHRRRRRPARGRHRRRRSGHRRAGVAGPVPVLPPRRGRAAWSTRVRTDEQRRAGRRHRQHLPDRTTPSGSRWPPVSPRGRSPPACGSRTSGSAACTWPTSSSKGTTAWSSSTRCPWASPRAPWPSSSRNSDGASSEATTGTCPVVDAHTMNPDVVLATLRRLGGSVERIFIVGCQPADLHDGMGLTPAVAAAVDDAADLCVQLVSELVEPVEKGASPMIRRLVRLAAARRRGRAGDQVAARHRPVPQDAGDVGRWAAPACRTSCSAPG